jgi:hypothetical protein
MIAVPNGFKQNTVANSEIVNNRRARKASMRPRDDMIPLAHIHFLTTGGPRNAWSSPLPLR